jgi:hypothetical protein
VAYEIRPRKDKRGVDLISDAVRDFVGKNREDQDRVVAMWLSCYSALVRQ